MVSCWQTVHTNVFTLRAHNLTRAEFDAYSGEYKTAIVQTWEHRGEVKNCPACGELMEVYIKQFLPRGGRMPIGYELEYLGAVVTYS